MTPIQASVRALLFAGSLAGSTCANAAIWCAGRVNTAYVGTNGVLVVDWGFQPILLCNVNDDVTLPSPQSFIGYKTCQSIESLALTAKSTGKDFMALLPSDADCSGLFNGGGVANKAIADFRIDQ